MVTIGICGSSGAGKSTLCRYLCRFGFIWLDCDSIYHELVSRPSDCLDAIRLRFGDRVVSNGALDRNALREIVFQEPKLASELNAITHPFVLNELENRIHGAKQENAIGCLIDAPMFFEAGLASRCDLVVGMIADRSSKGARLLEREGLSLENAEKRWNNQLSDDELRERCDYVVENSGSMEALEEQCNELIQNLITKFNLEGVKI